MLGQKWCLATGRRVSFRCSTSSQQWGSNSTSLLLEGILSRHRRQWVFPECKLDTQKTNKKSKFKTSHRLMWEQSFILCTYLLFITSSGDNPLSGQRTSCLVISTGCDVVCFFLPFRLLLWSTDCYKSSSELSSFLKMPCSKPTWRKDFSLCLLFCNTCNLRPKVLGWLCSQQLFIWPALPQRSLSGWF